VGAGARAPAEARGATTGPARTGAQGMSRRRRNVMTDMAPAPDPAHAQMSLAYPDLVPGDQVRYPHRRGWRFGVLVGLDGAHAVIAGPDGEHRQRVPASTVTPWPPR